MADASTSSISRRQLLEVAGTAAATLAATGIAGQAVAQTTQSETRTTTALKIEVKGPTPDIVVIPIEPVRTSGRPALSGQSPLLGQVVYNDDHEGRMDADGAPVFAAGHGALSAANGDGVFVEWVSLWSPVTTPGVFQGYGAFVVTGGKGNYCGAGGSGTLHITFDGPAKQLTFAFDGTVSTPKR